MEYTSLKIAEYLNGKLEGNSSLVVSNVAKIEEASTSKRFVPLIKPCAVLA